MNGDGIPLPSALSGVQVQRLVKIDEALLFLITGALVELADDWQFEETGSLTLEGVKEALSAMLWCFMEGCEVTPIGTIAIWPVVTAPDGWLKCQGQSLLRADYPELFAVLGTAYGSADGTHFGLPSYDDYSPMGAANIVAIGGYTGEQLHPITTAEMPIHNHAVTDPGHTHAPGAPFTQFAALRSGGSGAFNSGSSYATVAATASAVTGISTNNAGSGTPMSLVHPVRGVYFIIYTGV